MREILFRGKTDNGEWVEGCFGQHTSLDALIIHRPYPTINNDLTALDFWEVDPETVGQFTGLTDKNGTKIFEGDVVQVVYDTRRYGTYVVAMSEERGGWFPFACGDGCGCCECEVARPEHCEIIGNIHDNPELIEVQDNG